MASDLDEFAEDEAYADSVENMCLDAYLEGVERDNAALRLQRAERLRHLGPRLQLSSEPHGSSC